MLLARKLIASCDSCPCTPADYLLSHSFQLLEVAYSANRGSYQEFALKIQYGIVTTRMFVGVEVQNSFYGQKIILTDTLQITSIPYVGNSQQRNCDFQKRQIALNNTD